MTVVILIAGILVRSVGFDRSLWIDEFGTLWTIESSVRETWSRAIAFHGQSPFYYLLLWPLVHALGESEVLLRLPSLLLGAGATFLIFRTARAIGSTESGLFAVSVAWGAPVLMESSINARPYALAAFCAALAIHGFVLAVLTQRWRHRLQFIVGGVGLFLTQYVTSLLMLGLAGAFVGFAAIRRRYPWRAFLTDVAAQLTVVLVALPQLRGLWGRKEALDWLGPPDYGTLVSVVGPFVLPVMVAAAFAPHRDHPTRPAVERAMVLTVLAPILGMALLALVGLNLLAPRYLTVTAVPASILAGLALGRLRTPAACVSVLFSVGMVVTLTVFAWRSQGMPTTLPHQEWRAAVAALESELAATPDAFVLYRPGFVEQDSRGTVSPAVLAPLRSPGMPRRDWPLVPLTFSWGGSIREPYFAEVLVPKLEGARVFYVLISGTTPTTGHYGQLFLDWVQATFPERFAYRSVGPFAGIDLLRFDRVAR